LLPSAALSPLLLTREQRRRIKKKPGEGKQASRHESLLYMRICSRSSRVSMSINFAGKEKKELEKGSVCDIREQEEEPYFNPEFRGGFLVVFMWRRLSLSPVGRAWPGNWD